mmetsp:Transcript_88369/g.274704  ORF Transcript_88369/g.274704 Transcript_88369/m.274704 type:complete len:383 (+) Transcript_88369:317-1465(+)
MARKLLVMLHDVEVLPLGQDRRAAELPEGHGDGRGVTRADDVARLRDAGLLFQPRQSLGHRNLAEVLRVEEVVRGDGAHEYGTRRQGGAADLGEVDARRLAVEPPAAVAVHPVPEHLVDVHELVDGGRAIETKDLDQALGLDLVAAIQVHVPGREPLHRVHHDLCPVVIAGEEVDVADGKSCPLRYSDILAILARRNRIVLPRVIAGKSVRPLHLVKHLVGRGRKNALVDVPGEYPGHHQVLPPGHEVTLVCPLLEASPQVLDRERAHADDGHVLAPRLIVVKLVEHAVADLTAKCILPLVELLLREGQVPREHEDGGCREVVHLLLLLKPLQASQLQLLDSLELVRPLLLRVQGVAAVRTRQGCSPRPLHGIHSRVELHVG